MKDEFEELMKNQIWDLVHQTMKGILSLANGCFELKLRVMASLIGTKPVYWEKVGHKGL